MPQTALGGAEEVCAICKIHVQRNTLRPLSCETVTARKIAVLQGQELARFLGKHRLACVIDGLNTGSSCLNAENL